MTRLLPSALPLAAALALAACSGQEGGTGAFVQRAVPSAGAAGLTPVAPETAERIRFAREGQLQTPLDLPPEATGAPPPAEHDPRGPRIDQGTLAEAGVDTAPDVRIWERYATGAVRLRHGPAPTSAAEQALSRDVIVAPF